MVKKGLGRGFETLIPSDLFDDSFDPTAADDKTLSQLKELKLSDIKPDPNQPRGHFDEEALAQLTTSVKQHGILQPIVVTKQGNSYQIVAGERRYRASKTAGLATIPAIVRTLSAQNKLELALIENLQRHDLNALETATAYAKLRDQFNLTLEQIGQTVGGKSVSAVSNTLRLLRLAKPVQEAVATNKLTEGQARPLIDAGDAIVSELLPVIIKDQWSARKIEAAVREAKHPRIAPKTSQHDYQNDEKLFTKKVQTKTTISSNAKGGGQIVISFKDKTELDRIKRTLL